jgi:hypothetical protein
VPIVFMRVRVRKALINLLSLRFMNVKSLSIVVVVVGGGASSRKSVCN